MSRVRWIVGAVLLGCLAFAGTTVAKDGVADGPRAVAAGKTSVVGVYDSRAVATAWVRSKEFGEYVRGLRTHVDAALAAAEAGGDRELAASLRELGPAMQRRVHRQGFSTAPVDDVLARIADRLPAIAAEAGVDAIVSKWTLTWRAPDATFVDVTDRLVAEFHPDEATLRVIAELVAREPVPLEEIDGVR